jgi:hypothetical protein
MSLENHSLSVLIKLLTVPLIAKVADDAFENGVVVIGYTYISSVGMTFICPELGYRA